MDVRKTDRFGPGLFLDTSRPAVRSPSLPRWRATDDGLGTHFHDSPDTDSISTARKDCDVMTKVWFSRDASGSNTPRYAVVTEAQQAADYGGGRTSTRGVSCLGFLSDWIWTGGGFVVVVLALLVPCRRAPGSDSPLPTLRHSATHADKAPDAHRYPAHPQTPRTTNLASGSPTCRSLVLGVDRARAAQLRTSNLASGLLCAVGVCSSYVILYPRCIYCWSCWSGSEIYQVFKLLQLLLCQNSLLTGQNFANSF
ncbi:hypothetical protein B0H17DRAFT_136969 [Mycena rosella]|uniref:Uncharacterized protein n=1 Tax=Mycena rosella TaxID=1033263 RepID=A0AAD7GMM0_MYCRO|nr:hypothetical protein B0H17DRAFT_136969 [Mycena rosella]